MSEPDLPFHRIEAHKFEELAATVLEDKFQLPLLTFTSGRDRGRDAAARKVTFNIGGTTYTDHNVVVQVKHTKREGAKVDNSTCNRLFVKELAKVDRLVLNGQLDTYIVVMNYRLPAGQEEKIVHMFQKVGCKKVLVIGLETLNRWIKQSDGLSKKISKMYNLGDVSMRRAAIYTAKGIQTLRPAVTQLQGSLDTVLSTQADHADEVQHQMQEVKQDTTEMKKLVKQSSTEISGQIQQLQKQVSDLDRPCVAEDASSALHKLDKKTDEIHHMLRSVKHTIENTEETGQSHAKKLCLNKDRRQIGKCHIDKNQISFLIKQAGFLSQWKFVARSLGLDESDIQTIEHSNCNLKEQAYNMLIHWQNQPSPCESSSKLQEALISCRLHSIAEKLKTE